MTDGQVRELIDAIKESGGSKNDIFGKGKDSERFREKVVKVVAKTDEDELRDRISREDKQHNLMTAAMDKTTGFVRTVVEKIKGAFETVTGFIGGIFNFLPFGGLLKGAAVIGGMILGWKKLQPFLDKPEIKDWFSNFFDNVFKVVNGIIRWFWNTFTAGEKLDENWDVRDWAKNKYTQIMNGRSIPEFLWDVFVSVTAKIVSWITGEDVTSDDIKNHIQTAAKSLQIALTETSNEILNGIRSITKIIDDLSIMVSGIISQFQFEIGLNKERLARLMPGESNTSQLKAAARFGLKKQSEKKEITYEESKDIVDLLTDIYGQDTVSSGFLQEKMAMGDSGGLFDEEQEAFFHDILRDHEAKKKIHIGNRNYHTKRKHIESKLNQLEDRSKGNTEVGYMSAIYKIQELEKQNHHEAAQDAKFTEEERKMMHSTIIELSKMSNPSLAQLNEVIAQLEKVNKTLKKTNSPPGRK
jgi:hypothetical protein